MRKIAVVGIGRLGGALAIALARKGLDVAYLIYRSHGTAAKVASEMPARPILIGDIGDLAAHDPDLILITTGDPEIGPVVDELAKVLNGKETILHTSGSLSSDILDGLSNIGCSIGSIHPLISISDYSNGANSFEGAYFCVEGDEIGNSIGVELSKTLGGNPFVVDPNKKALYHAAAVMACGHVTALIDMANTMMAKCGIEDGNVSKILLPLIESTMENIKKQGTAAALTGSFARADAGAVNRHINAIENEMDSETLEIYRLLGDLSLKIAERNGVDRSRISNLRKLIQDRT